METSKNEVELLRAENKILREALNDARSSLVNIHFRAEEYKAEFPKNMKSARGVAEKLGKWAEAAAAADTARAALSGSV